MQMKQQNHKVKKKKVGSYGVPKFSSVLLLLCHLVTCHRPFLPGTFLEPAVNPIAQVSSFTL